MRSHRQTFKKFLNDKPTHRKYAKEFQQAKAQSKFGLFWLLIFFTFALVIYLTSIFN